MNLPWRSVVAVLALAAAGAGAGTAQAAGEVAVQSPGETAAQVAAGGAEAAAPEPATAPANDPEIGVQLEPSTPAVGDPVVATLSVTLTGADAGREATFPDWTQGWGEAEIQHASPVETATTPDGVVLKQRLQLTAFRPGAIALPPVEIRLGGEPSRRITTPRDLVLEVRSVIAADDKELKAAPPSPPRSLALPRGFWWALAGGGALVILAAVLAWRRRPASDPLAAPQLSPLAELERALGLLAGQAPDGAFTLLSQALRRYLGRKLGFHALESTTTEVQRRLAGLRFEPALVQRATRLLRLADQIKFARRSVEPAEAEARIAETRDLAGSIEILLAPPPDAASDAPAAGQADAARRRSASASGDAA